MDYLIFVVVFFAVIVGLRFLMLKKVKKKIGKEIDVLLFDKGAQKLLSKEKSVLYFYTNSCSSCKVQKPIIDKLDKETNAVIKIDISEQPAIASEFGIMGVPTIVIMQNAGIANIFVGRQSETILRTAYNKI